MSQKALWQRPSVSARWRVAFLIATAGFVGGCASPIFDPEDNALRQSVLDSARRELADAASNPDRRTLTRQMQADDLDLKPEILQQLQEQTGPASYIDAPAPLGDSLLGGEQKTVPLSLERAIKTAVENNLNIQFARLAPAIEQAQLVAADAAFDWVFFTNFQWTNQDEPRTSPSIGGRAVGLASDERQVVEATAGLRKRLISGGQFTFQHEFQYTDVETANLFNAPDPARDTNVVLQVDQPLLRNFGSDAALAEVRLARNSERNEVQILKGELIQTITDTEEAYWNLVKSYSDLRILQRLYERGEAVRAILQGRRAFDVKQSEYTDTVATCQSRKGDVMRAQNALRKTSDRLKTLLNDPEFTIGEDSLLLPTDTAIDQPVIYSLFDCIQTALANRPEVQRAILSIDNTSIRQQVADSARLPQLDLRAQTRWSGLGGSSGDSYDNLSEGNFINYLLGLTFEQPIGNRAAEAGFTQRRLERMQAVIAYRNTVQGIVAEVRAALEDLRTNYELIEQTKIARIAAAENLRTLEIEERLLVGRNPDLLDRKLRSQQALAGAEQEEFDSMIDYNVALASLYAAMGTALERNRIEFQAPDPDTVRFEPPEFPIWPSTDTSASAVKIEPQASPDHLGTDEMPPATQTPIVAPSPETPADPPPATDSVSPRS